MRQAPGEKACDRNQRDRDRQLRHEHGISQAEQTAPDAAGRQTHRSGRRGSRRSKRRNEREANRRGNGHRDGEKRDPRVDHRVQRYRDRQLRTPGCQRSCKPSRDDQATSTSDRRQQGAFDEQLTDHVSPARTNRQPNRHLPTTCQAACQHDARDIRARHDQHQEGRNHDGPGGRKNRAIAVWMHDDIGRRQDPERAAFVADRIRRLEAASDHGARRGCVRDRRTILETALYEHPAFVSVVQLILPERAHHRDRRPHVRRESADQQPAEFLRCDADDRVLAAVQRNTPADH